MSSPDRQEEMPRREGEPKSYSLAARYPNERASEQPYQEVQDVIFRHRRLNISTYRLQLPRATSSEMDWHVAVVGEQPPAEFDARFRRILSTGELIVLPQDVLDFLHRRRAEANELAPWVEGHYPTGLRRRIR